jgi:hypothetical protein
MPVLCCLKFVHLRDGGAAVAQPDDRRGGGGGRLAAAAAAVAGGRLVGPRQRPPRHAAALGPHLPKVNASQVKDLTESVRVSQACSHSSLAVCTQQARSRGLGSLIDKHA